MKEFDLLSVYPLLNKRFVSKNTRKIENRIIASYRGREFYDGKRDNGYGGFKYDGRLEKIASRIFKHYKLREYMNHQESLPYLVFLKKNQINSLSLIICDLNSTVLFNRKLKNSKIINLKNNLFCFLFFL